MKTLTRFVVLLAPLVSGCTLAGAGIGALVPRYEDQRGASTGDEVAVVAVSGEHVSGTVVENDGHTLVVGGAPNVALRFHEISELRVRVGTHAKQGMLIGAAIDGGVALVTFIALFAAPAISEAVFGAIAGAAGRYPSR